MLDQSEHRIWKTFKKESERETMEQTKEPK